MKQFFSIARLSGSFGLAGLLACTGCGRPSATSPEPAKSAQSLRREQSATRDLFGSLRTGEDHLAANPSAISAQPTVHATPVLADPATGEQYATATKGINPPFDLFDSSPSRGQTSRELKSAPAEPAESASANGLPIESYFSGFSTATKPAVRDARPADPKKAAEAIPRVADVHPAETKSPPAVAVEPVPKSLPPETKPLPPVVVAVEPIPKSLPAEAKLPPPVVTAEPVAKCSPDDSRLHDAVKPISIRAAQPLPEQTTMLPWARIVPEGPELEAVCDRADQALRRGCALAERGATYSARAEFIQALRTLADGLDARQENKWHAKALMAGLLALREVDDFQSGMGRAESTLPMEVLIGSHRTPVCQDVEVQEWTPAEATDRYHEYAQQQLAAAMGGESLGSLALYTFARIHTALDGPGAEGNDALLAKAMSCHCAALLVDPKNFMAANELGVLLARRGDWDKAQAVLNQSLTTAPQVVTWENLAVVYEHLGNAAMGQVARKEAATLAADERQKGQGTLSGRPNIHWLDPTSFAQTTSPTEAHDNGAIKTPAPITADRTGSWLPWTSTKR